MNFTPSFIKTKEKAGNPIDDVRYAPITSYMTTELITFTEDQMIHEAITVMLKHKISGAPVLNEQGELTGIISEKDCLKVLIDEAYYNNPLNHRQVKDYMTENVKTLSVNTNIVDAARNFINSSFRRFPVVDDNGRLAGQISRKDILKAARRLHSTTWFS